MSDQSPNNDAVEEIVLTLIFLNADETALGERGLLSSGDVHGCTADVIINTDVSYLCLPSDIIQKLNLRWLERVNAQTTEGFRAVDLYGWVMFDIDGSSDYICKCMELLIGETPLIGQIPLSEIGLEPDLDYPCVLRQVSQDIALA